MKHLIATAFAAVGLATPSPALAGPITLQQVLFNLNGSTYLNTYAVPGLDSSLFNATLGLGTLQLTFHPGAAGTYFFDVFFDHQLHAQLNNEFSFVGGAPGPGRSWQIDVPSTGNILANTLANTLDNTDHVNGGGSHNDVSIALGFNFILSANEFAVITVNARQTQPPGGFYLEQVDFDSPDFLFVTEAFSIQQGPPAAVPEPASLTLLMVGVASLTGSTLVRRRFSRSARFP
jgi:hypothetical protein